jgi:CHASE3 domain sensor protein
MPVYQLGRDRPIRMTHNRALHHADDSGRLVARSHQTLQAAEETLRRVVDAETWERGHLLTHDADDLAASSRSQQLAGAPMENLTAILREDGREVDAERLRAQIAATLADFERLVERTRAGSSSDAPTRATARVNMETVRATIRAIRHVESDVLNARIRADASAGRWVNWLAIVITGLATALMTTLVGALVFLARRASGAAARKLDWSGEVILLSTSAVR